MARPTAKVQSLRKNTNDRLNSLVKTMPFHFPIRLFLLVALTALPMVLQAGNVAAKDTRSLKQAAGERFLMGVGTSSKVLAKAKSVFQAVVETSSSNRTNHLALVQDSK